MIDGVKAWITHGGEADFYTVFARTAAEGPDGPRDQLLPVPADAPGLSAAPAERKMGMRASPTAQVHFDGAGCRPSG